MEIKNLKKSAERILQAVKNKEKIILYGDADLDGVTSVIILKEAIKNLGGETVSVYFPDREAEGYGITNKGLDTFKKISPALLITLDLGIGNFKEVLEAKRIGLGVIIIDHHQILDKLPRADIVVDPKQKGEKYPFKELATVGIAFKLSQELFKDKMSSSLKENFLELTALGTIADMMPKEADNEIFIREGLVFLKNSWRPGIKTFFQGNYLPSELILEQKVSKFISLLNIRDVENNLPGSFRLLTTSSYEEAKALIEKLLEKNILRKQKINEITEEIERRILEKEEAIIFEGDATFEFILISTVASQICNKYKKPTFIFKKMEKESLGTVRTPQGINSVELMKKCKEYLLTFGGHPQASGFRIKNENLEQFKNCLIRSLAI